jgi:hypothetical protein
MSYKVSSEAALWSVWSNEFPHTRSRLTSWSATAAGTLPFTILPLSIRTGRSPRRISSSLHSPMFLIGISLAGRTSGAASICREERSFVSESAG